MTPLTVYPLQPFAGGGFHFGELGLELEESAVTFPSDSLFAALVATVAEQEGAAAADAFTQPFTPPAAASFRLTSAYPRAGQLPLLPLPRLPIHTPSWNEAQRAEKLPRKFVKDVRFVSPGICQLLCNGADMVPYLTDSHGRFLQDGAVWLTAVEQAQLPAPWRTLDANPLSHQTIWRQGQIPRVSIDRIHHNSNVYLMGRVSFNTECGLWLGVAYADSADPTRLEELLAHLGDRGIGGERSNGYGAFTLDLAQKQTLTLGAVANGATDSAYQLLLSRCLLQPDELPALRAAHASYQLVTVGGWLATPSPGIPHLRRKQITLVAEGSVLGTAVSGYVANVQPQWDNFPHPVYRYGLALSAPVAAAAVEDSP